MSDGTRFGFDVLDGGVSKPPAPKRNILSKLDFNKGSMFALLAIASVFALVVGFWPSNKKAAKKDDSNPKRETNVSHVHVHNYSGRKVPRKVKDDSEKKAESKHDDQSKKDDDESSKKADEKPTDEKSADDEAK